MCTVTYIPQSEDAFILTHSRDEKVLRGIASPPVIRKINGIKHIFPVDPKGGGTWIGVGENNRVACLLNGGTNKHIPHPPYRQSRGLIIPDLFSYDSFSSFYNDYSFDGIEPFTLVVMEDNQIFELRVEEKILRIKELDRNIPHIYSSATLYSPEVAHNRKVEFHEWLKTQEKFTQAELLKLHSKFRYELLNTGKPTNNNTILKTVSTTSILKSKTQAEVLYFDRVNDMQLIRNLKFKNIYKLENAS